MDFDALQERLLSAPYHVIDLLPRQVPPEGGARYAAVEQFYLQPARLRELYRRFAALLLKLNCYFDFALCSGETWEASPAPQTLYDRFAGCGEGGYVNVLLPAEQTLLTLSGGDLCLTLYHPSEAVLRTAALLARAEGLFLWRPPQDAPAP